MHSERRKSAVTQAILAPGSLSVREADKGEGNIANNAQVGPVSSLPGREEPPVPPRGASFDV